MKKDIVLYERIYQILKNKIESGLLPYGSKLPSRANMCRVYNTSEKTVRRAIDMLAQDGYVETAKRKCPTVSFDCSNQQLPEPYSLKRANAAAANDILKTGILICYPVNAHGLKLCAGKEWEIPEAILKNMDLDKPTAFWRLSNRFWRFFTSRNENEMILRVVDSLGFTELDPMPGTREMRANYRTGLEKLVLAMKQGGNWNHIHFEDMSVLFGFLNDPKGLSDHGVHPDSPLRNGVKGMERELRGVHEQYSNIYLDILGLITVGYYKPGERLPSHSRLREIYEVSGDTVVRALKVLAGWNVVTARQGQGVFVSDDIQAPEKVHISPELIAPNVRRYLDSLELLSLTAEGVAAHAAAFAGPDEIIRLRREADALKNGLYRERFSSVALLDFIVNHIQYDALRVIYRLIQENYQFCWRIPQLLVRDKKMGKSEIYGQYMEAVGFLGRGDLNRFAKTAAGVFQNSYQLAIEEYRRLGYWEAAMHVYDGTALWK